ncbi:MAG: hypothetical protein LBL87_01700 [Ruminococcus sp.]|jgi:hypothetical protein|nr:hypothetical protein [Ruminococcus sp.]
MKNLKSFLAIIMVLVIGVCLTGCQSAEEIAESERLVSESVSESERAVSESVSESVSASESVVASESLAVSESIAFSESVAASESLKIEEENMKVSNAEFQSWFPLSFFIIEEMNIYFSDKAFSELINSGVKYAPNELSMKETELNIQTNIPLTKSVSVTIYIGDDEYTSDDCKAIAVISDQYAAVYGLSVLFHDLTEEDQANFLHRNTVNDSELEVTYQEVNVPVDDEWDSFLEDAGIDAVSVTIKDDNGEENTLTYYPNVE